MFIWLSGSGWRGSPRHTSPSFRREKSRPTSKRNSSCLDESEAHWEPWRYDSETLDGPDDIYAPIYYPGRNSTSRPTPTPLSRVSPASSSSAVSGTPSSDSRFTDFHDKLEKISSYFKYDEDERVVSRPPHTGGRRSIHTPKYMDIPNSNTSSRSNISPFGRTPPSGVSGSPTVSWYLHFAIFLLLIHSFFLGCIKARGLEGRLVSSSRWICSY